MNNNNPLFILAGNGSYGNRGCEAITRGTVHIMRNFFEDPEFVAVSLYKNNDQYRQQCRNETDMSIIHKEACIAHKRLDPLWCLYSLLKLTCPGLIKHVMFKDVKSYLEQASAVLSVGGDNFSLDYANSSKTYTGLNDLVIAKGKPLFIWGASVGPFSKNPTYEKYMSEHLKKVTIFARESMTVEYLARLGLTENVHLVADPAFLMAPTKPQGASIPEIEDGAIGLNLSPLMSRFVSDGNLKEWTSIAADIINEILKQTDRRIYLIPHVMGRPLNDDHIFMKNVLLTVSNGNNRIVLIPPTFNASETKWIISKMAVFAGARMHSTVASLSSCVPTLSLAYSIKAKGLNKDIFGHSRYCISGTEFVPGAIAERIKEILQESENIRTHLNQRIPEIKDLAMSSGRILQEMLP